MLSFGLLGRTLGHSRSPEIHAALGDYDYQLFEVEPDSVGSFMAAREFSGLNVTVPYKKTVMEYLDELTGRARGIGSVNTVIVRDGKLIGDNTDATGFEYMLRRGNVKVNGQKVLVLGSGGASAAIKYVLRCQGAAEIVTISRTGENNYDNISVHKDADVIVNTTPVGMWPNCNDSPLAGSLECFEKLSAVLDIVYNPLRTNLMLDAERRGIPTVGGLYMLVEQAAEASRLFVGTDCVENDVERIVGQIGSDMMNIVLIGMPGCGKSSIGQEIAAATGREFVDSDAVIVQRAGKSIPEIFAEDGEEAFRRLESDVLRDIMSKSGQIVATGGGCVTREENYNTLRRSGVVVYIERSLNRLARRGRPLSQGADLKKMFADRQNKYETFADITVKNNKTVSSCARKIIRAVGEDIQPVQGKEKLGKCGKCKTEV